MNPHARVEIVAKNVTIFSGNYFQFKDFLLKFEDSFDAEDKERLLNRYFSGHQEYELECQKKELSRLRWNQIEEEIENENSLFYKGNRDAIIGRLKKRADLLLDKWLVRPRHNRVADFATWMFHVSKGKLYKPGEKNEKSLSYEKGKKRIPNLCDNKNWKCVYRDLRASSGEPLRISTLTVQNQSFFGRPDYVFRNKSDGRILIVDVADSLREIPFDGWSNLRAKLWAYGHIDNFFRDSTEIILVSEIWDSLNLDLRRTFVWKLSNESFYWKEETNFLAYRSWIEEKMSWEESQQKKD
jgi:hypothetical protein